MSKLTLLVLLVLPACVSQEQLAESRAKRLSYAEDVCHRRGVTPGSDDYLKCVQGVGTVYGYRLVSDGTLAFIVPPPSGGMGQERTFYPATYVPPVYNYPNGPSR